MNKIIKNNNENAYVMAAAQDITQIKRVLERTL